MWVRADSVFQAVVDARQFFTAQGIIRERSQRLSNDDLLEKLRLLHERQGWLSGILIDETEDMPSSSIYSYRFGGLTRAYKLIGYDAGRDLKYIEENKRLRNLYPKVIEQIIEQITSYGGKVNRNAQNNILIVNNEIKVSLIICRCKQKISGHKCWNIHFDTGLLPDITIAVRMDDNNETIRDYYLIPAIDIENPSIRLRENNHLAIDSYRFDDLEPFFMMSERDALPEAA